MTYKIWDRQLNKYFGDNAEFETLEEIKKQLKSYHENDIEGMDKEQFNRMTLSDLLEVFDWEIHNDKDVYVEVI